MCTGLFVQALVQHGEEPSWFILAITLWLWFTVLFANFAEAMAEGHWQGPGRGLEGLKKTVMAKKLAEPRHGAATVDFPSQDLRKGDVVLIEAGDVVPGDGEVIEGVASVDESAITGESAPVIRESGGDFCAVTGGTRVLSDWLVVRITTNPGETFLDRMIGMVEGAKRKKSPNEIALTILLVALTLTFLMATATLLPFSIFSVRVSSQGTPVSVTVLIALLGVPDSDYYRWTAFSHWCGRNGPDDGKECHCHLGQGGRDGRRCGRVAARQNWHHHAWQPASDAFYPPRVCMKTSWPMLRCCHRWLTRRQKAAR